MTFSVELKYSLSVPGAGYAVSSVGAGDCSAAKAAGKLHNRVQIYLGIPAQSFGGIAAAGQQKNNCQQS